MNYERYIYELLGFVVEDDFRTWYVYFLLSVLLDRNDITECEYNFLYDFIHSIGLNHDLAYLEYTD